MNWNNHRIFFPWPLIHNLFDKQGLLLSTLFQSPWWPWVIAPSPRDAVVVLDGDLWCLRGAEGIWVLDPVVGGGLACTPVQLLHGGSWHLYRLQLLLERGLHAGIDCGGWGGEGGVRKTLRLAILSTDLFILKCICTVVTYSSICFFHELSLSLFLVI